jgi:hypothetical protein
MNGNKCDVIWCKNKAQVRYIRIDNEEEESEASLCLLHAIHRFFMDYEESQQITFKFLRDENKQEETTNNEEVKSIG